MDNGSQIVGNVLGNGRDYHLFAKTQNQETSPRPLVFVEDFPMLRELKPSDLEVIDIDLATVVRFRGEKIALDDVNIYLLGIQLFLLIEEPTRCRLILDMANVEYLNGSALALLLTLNRRLAALGGLLTLENLNPLIMENFAITKLDQVFNIRKETE
jgi:anti-anti-sigma factor